MVNKQEAKRLDEKIELIYDHVLYMRDRVDSLVWRMVLLGSVSGAVSAAITALALLTSEV
jgi:hypothetical protein